MLIVHITQMLTNIAKTMISNKTSMMKFSTKENLLARHTTSQNLTAVVVVRESMLVFLQSIHQHLSKNVHINKQNLRADSCRISVRTNSKDNVLQIKFSTSKEEINVLGM